MCYEQVNRENMNLTACESVQKGNGQVSAQYYNVFMLLVSCFSFVKQTTGKSTENHEDRRYSWMLFILFLLLCIYIFQNGRNQRGYHMQKGNKEGYHITKGKRIIISEVGKILDAAVTSPEKKGKLPIL